MSTRSLFLLSFLAVCGILGTSLYLQYVESFMPCPLCTMQRLAFGAVGIVSLLGFLFYRRRFVTLPSSLFAMLFSIAGFIFAARQTWLQLYPAADGTECGVSLQYMLQVLPLHEVMTKILAGSAECSDRSWAFLSLTMPEWGVICFAILFCLGSMALIREVKDK